MTSHHDLNPCKVYVYEVTYSVLIPSENPEHVDTTCGLDEDPSNTPGEVDSEKAHIDYTCPHRDCPTIIYGVGGANSHYGDSCSYPDLFLTCLASMTGVGDNPNVGTSHGSPKNNACYCDSVISLKEIRVNTTWRGTDSVIEARCSHDNHTLKEPVILHSL